MCRRINIDEIYCIVYVRDLRLYQQLNQQSWYRSYDLQGNSQIHLNDKSEDTVTVESGKMCTLQGPD